MGGYTSAPIFFFAARMALVRNDITTLYHRYNTINIDNAFYFLFQYFSDE